MQNNFLFDALRADFLLEAYGWIKLMNLPSRISEKYVEFMYSDYISHGAATNLGIWIVLKHL